VRAAAVAPRVSSPALMTAGELAQVLGNDRVGAPLRSGANGGGRISVVECVVGVVHL
jgi:hypothetical protein